MGVSWFFLMLVDLGVDGRFAGVLLGVATAGLLGVLLVVLVVVLTLAVLAIAAAVLPTTEGEAILFLTFNSILFFLNSSIRFRLLALVPVDLILVTEPSSSSIVLLAPLVSRLLLLSSGRFKGAPFNSRFNLIPSNLVNTLLLTLFDLINIPQLGGASKYFLD